MKEEAVVETTETDTDLKNFMDAYDDPDDEEPETEETQEEGGEETSEPETEVKDKTAKWSIEEYQQAYKNLEKKLGEQGHELGELRKRVSEPEKKADDPIDYNPDQIPDIPDEHLKVLLRNYENYFNQKDINITDSENFGRITAEYQKLLQEQTLRNVSAKASKAQIAEKNAQAVATFSKQWDKVLTPEQVAQASEFARAKLSDDGSVTCDDLEVAMHRLFPSIYRSKVAQEIADKERKRIADAQTKTTPRIPSSGSETRSSLISVDKYMAMDMDEKEQYLYNLSPDQLAAFKSLVNKK